MKNNKILDILILSIVWILVIYLIKPGGNFPISDDFSYIETVKRLYKTGEFKPHLWTSMTLFSQAYLGYSYSLIVGFSIEKLRILVSILGLIGIIFTYLTSIELKIERKISLFITVLLGFNPVFLHYSLSFMTDVPFFCFSIISIYFYLLTLNKFSGLYWFLASIFSIIAVLTRQIGLFIPLAFFITYLIKEKINVKSIFYSLLPLISSIIIYLFYIKWLELNNIKPYLFNNQGRIITDKFKLIEQLIKNIISNLSFSLLYVSMFISPLLLVFYKKILNKNNFKLTILSSLFSGLIFLILFLIFKNIIPVNKNVLTSLNIIGPFDDSTFYNLENNLFFCVVLTVFSVVGLFLLTLFSIKHTINIYYSLKKRKPISIEIIFIFFCLLVYQAPILLVTTYERYFFISIVLISFIVAVYFKEKLVATNINKGYKIGIALLLIISTNSIIQKKDFMEHNRVRWDILNGLIKKGINPKEISGGFSFYGTYCDEYFKNHIQEDTSFEKNLKYYVSILPDKNMKIISKHPFKTFYKIGGNIFYVSKKIK